MSDLLLVDASAYARGGAAGTGTHGELCLCAVTRMELLYSARSATDYVDLEADLARFRDLPMDAETFATAATAHRELGQAGRHRVPIPDLLIAACAQQRGADVLHVDRHFDTLSSVLNFRAVRL